MTANSDRPAFVRAARLLPVDIFHSGQPKRSMKAPFLVVPAGSGSLPAHPNGTSGHWEFWKTVPCHEFAVDPRKTEANLSAFEFYIQ